MIKKQIEPLLLNLLSFNSEMIPVKGLLMEKMGLGLKRRLTKFRDELVVHFEELKRDEEEVKATYEGDGVKIHKELELLYNETITLQSEPALMSEIEKIETEQFYDFSLLEMITK